MFGFGKKSASAETHEDSKLVEETRREQEKDRVRIDDQWSYVNPMSEWIAARRQQNHFGEDLEIIRLPKGGRA